MILLIANDKLIAGSVLKSGKISPVVRQVCVVFSDPAAAVFPFPQPRVSWLPWGHRAGRTGRSSPPRECPGHGPPRPCRGGCPYPRCKTGRRWWCAWSASFCPARCHHITVHYIPQTALHLLNGRIATKQVLHYNPRCYIAKVALPWFELRLNYNMLVGDRVSSYISRRLSRRQGEKPGPSLHIGHVCSLVLNVHTPVTFVWGQRSLT